MPGSIDPIFMWLIGGDYRKVPFNDQLCHSSKMAAMPAILDLVSIDFLTNAWVDWSDFWWLGFGFRRLLCIFFCSTQILPLSAKMALGSMVLHV
jgi:hypothetical protein